MLVVNDLKLRLAWSVCSLKDLGLMLSVAIKSGFLMRPDSPIVSQPEAPECSGDQYREDEEVPTTLVYPSDFAIFKPRADVVLIGAAHAPGGRFVSHRNVALRVGQFKKALFLAGDRLGERQSQSDPIRSQSARVAFGPISPNLKPRRSKVGTYKGRWAKERWPWFPDDFDWSYFNAAPEDQQVEGYLRGDEELEFQNLHPEHPLYRSRLPGLRARAFVQIEVTDAPSEFREVTLNLDTLWIDMDSEKIVLVWRGLTPVRSLKLKEVTHLAALTEPLASPLRPKEEIREWMLQRVREERGEGPPTTEEAAEEAAAKASWETFEKEMAAMDKEKAELEKEFDALDKEVDQQLKQEKARLVAEGIDPKILEGTPKPQTAAGLKTQLAAEIARLAETDPEAAAKFAGVENELDEFEKMDQEFAALGAEESPPPTRESVQADIAEGIAVRGADLSGQDLSNLDFSGADFSGTDFSRTNLSGTKLIGARLAGTDFSEANLAGADLSHAILDRAGFSEAKFQSAKFSGASVEGSSFSGLELPGADFSGCTGQHANFSASNLERANFSGAKLPQADFCGAYVKGASFLAAELAAADFGGASAAGINMEKADLTNLRAGEKADFTGGKFREAKAPKSIWEKALLDRADFSRAVLKDALFEDASVTDTRFDRADLTKASFEGALAQRAVLTNANLLRVSFNRTDLREASLAGSNLYEASFWETVFGHTSIEGANIKRTLLA